MQRRVDFPDSRELAQLEAEAREMSATVALRQSDPRSAVEHLHEALVLKERHLRANRRPIVYSIEAGFRNDQGLKLFENLELAAFCGYAETQLRLASVLQSLGQPYEAERLLGECVFTACNLCDVAPERSLRNIVLYGRTWTAVAELIAIDRPDEAQQARNAADQVWQVMAVKFPAIVRHPELGPEAIERIAWHKENGPRTLSAEHWKSYRRAVFPNIPFINRARGLGWFHTANWNDAIMFLKRSADSRSSGQAYDWFYLAMAYHHQGNRDEAKTWFDRAAAALGNGAPPELIELRAEAERVLSDSNEAQTDKK
jgi:tetratricopeptide (TPR) repeat protein